MESLCKSCSFRHRRVFLLKETEEYDDDSINNSNIIIMLTCMLIDIDISGEDTIDCNKYERNNDRKNG